MSDKPVFFFKVTGEGDGEKKKGDAESPAGSPANGGDGGGWSANASALDGPEKQGETNTLLSNDALLGPTAHAAYHMEI